MAQPVQILLLSQKDLLDSSQVSVSYTDPCGNEIPIYVVESSSSKPHMQISYAGAQGNIIGAASYHSISSKIDVSVYGESISMKRKDPLASGHSFHSSRLPELQWKEEDIISSNLKLVDSNKFVLARYRKRLDSHPRRSGFEIFVQADQALLDAIVVTGMAAVIYRHKSNKEWDKVWKKALKDAIIGDA